MKYPSKKELQEAIIINPDSEDKMFKLTKPLVYELSSTFKLIIPKGFEFDGDSNPFKRGQLDYGRLVASIPHDYIYRTQTLSRALADALIYDILKHTKGLTVAIIYYITLRLFGFKAWKENQSKGLEKYPNAKKEFYKLICNAYDKEN